MKLNNLSLRDRDVFSKYLNRSGHGLSVYSFENIYIWKGLFEIKWAFIQESLCVFFYDKIGAFLYLSPLSQNLEPDVVKEVFGILDGINANKEISRVENAEENDLAAYRAMGLISREKSVDYLCLRRDLSELKGDKFRHKRAAYNYFVANFPYEYKPYSTKDLEVCFRLYNAWAAKRRQDNPDPFYRAMLQDSLKALKILLKHYDSLDCLGRVVKIDGKIKGFTFGFKLNSETFCILYEITDLSIKGLAQFIFRAFCAELAEYKYINIMDDSGLENLKKVKLSYRPVKLVPAYTITRKK